MQPTTRSAVFIALLLLVTFAAHVISDPFPIQNISHRYLSTSKADPHIFEGCVRATNPKEGLFDVVYVVHSKDLGPLRWGMRSLLCRVVGIGKVWVISDDASSVKALLAELGNEVGSDRIGWFNEKDFPFTWRDVDRVMHCSSKCGWYFQQLLKLYAGRAIPGIRDYLVVDADLVWYGRRVELVAEAGSDGRPVAYFYNTAAQKHTAYFDHMSRLTGGAVTRVHPTISGVVHHMIFKRDVLEGFMRLCEMHAGPNVIFWQAFLEAIDPSAYNSVSEYELYFNYALKFHPQTIRLRHLTFANGPRPGLVYNGGDESKTSGTVWFHEAHAFEKQMALDQRQGYTYVGYHSYARRRYFDVPQSSIHLYCELGIAEKNTELQKRCS